LAFELVSWHSNSRPELSSLSMSSVGKSVVQLSTVACESSTALASSQWFSGRIFVVCVPVVHLVPMLWYGLQ